MAQFYDGFETSSDAARECAYRFLAAALTDPRRQDKPQRFLRRIADFLPDIFADISLDVESLGAPERELADLNGGVLLDRFRDCSDRLADEFDRVFGLQAAPDVPPYETEYFPNSEPFFRSQQMADISGFYRAFSLQPSQWTRERPDHAALELEFAAFVLLKRRMASTRDEVCRSAGPIPNRIDPARAFELDTIEVCDDIFGKFFATHLDWWLPAFGKLLAARDPNGFYGAVGRFLCAFITSERRRLGLAPSSLDPSPKSTDEPEGCEGCTVQIEGLKA